MDGLYYNMLTMNAEKNLATQTYGAKSTPDQRRGHGWAKYSFAHKDGEIWVWLSREGWTVALLDHGDMRFKGHQFGRINLEDALEDARERAGLPRAITLEVTTTYREGFGHEEPTVEIFNDAKRALNYAKDEVKWESCKTCVVLVKSLHGGNTTTLFESVGDFI
jgi:hypothetical protein